MNYRADIDGLRAFAVIPIILFHLDFTKLFGGGYAGVDIFYVISGFLITSIIYRETTGEGFSFLKFYERRIRRIIPPLAFMALVATVLAVCLFSPAYLLNYLVSLRYMFLFSSNIFFWQDTDYFALPDATKALLHTWSLGVEEQFYIVFPIVLFLLVKYAGKHALKGLVFLWLISFALNIHFVFREQPLVFYMLPFRAWELLTGSILAVYRARANVTPPYICGIAGLLLICVSVVSLGYVNKSHFPGALALIPVAGAALCILAGDGSIVGRVLAWKPFVHIGRLSYAMYLWHWVLITFYKYQFGAHLDIRGVITLVLATYLLSANSYRLVEQPIRKKHLLASRSKLFVAAMSVIIVFMAGSVAIEKYTPRDVRYDNYQAQIKDFPELKWGEFYTLGNSNATSSILIMGNSHTEAVYTIFETLCGENNRRCTLAAHGSPLFGTHRTGFGKHKQYQTRLKEVISGDNITDLVIVIRWDMDDLVADNGLKDLDALKYGLENTINAVKERNPNVRVWLQLPVPVFAFNIPDHVYRRLETRQTLAEYNAQWSYIIPLLRSFNARLIDPAAMLCDSRYCYGVLEDTVMYVDEHHMSIKGTFKVRNLYEPIFQP
ncbi:acyltransferase family protein [Deferribacterales bacterium RsTz2092]|nr:acyltransferase [Deferribacterales bacterium]